MMNLGKPLTPQQTAAYLRTLPAIRERCGRVHALAQKGELQYFTYDPEKEEDIAQFCVDIIKVGHRATPSAAYVRRAYRQR